MTINGSLTHGCQKRSIAIMEHSLSLNFQIKKMLAVAKCLTYRRAISCLQNKI